MPSVRDLVEVYLTSEDAEQFSQWAFGPDYLGFKCLHEFMDKWNDLHSDLLTLDESGYPVHDIPDMIQIWKDHKKLLNDQSILFFV